MTDLNELQFFVQVARAHSFTRAAGRLDVPKSSVSRALARLERRLGVRLLDRTTRSVSLTEAGEVYLEHCQRVLEEAEQADLAVGALLGKPRGTLRIGAPLIFARSVLGPALGEFLAAYPELRLNLQPLVAESPSREKRFDVMIWTGPLEDSALLVKPLMRIRLGAYASPRYLANRKVPDTPGALREYDCIAASCSVPGLPGSSAIWRLRRGAEVKEVRVEARVSVPDPAVSHQLAVAGVGVALLSHAMARADVAQGRLVRLLPEWEPEPVQIHALYSSRLSSSPKVRVLLQFLQERLTDEPRRALRQA